MYYRIALVAQPTYRDDDPAWVAYEQLACAGHAVEIVDPSLVGPVLDETGRLDETAFARFRETFRPDYVSLGNQSAEQIISACRRNGAPGQTLPAKRFVVYGYLGKDNFGDEFIFSTVRREIMRRWPEAVITAVGQDPRATFARHGVAGVEPDMKFRLDILLNGATALLFLAGLVFDYPVFDHTAGKIDLFLNPYSEIPGQVSCVQLAWMHQVPTHYLGIGAGPLENPDACALMRLAALCRPRFTARDEKTVRLLTAAGVDASLIEQTADVALTVSARREEFSPQTAPERPFVSISMRDFPTVDRTFVARVASALDRFSRAHGLDLVFLDFAPEDRSIHERTAHALEQSDERRVSFVDATTSEDDVLRTLASSSLVLATRLHASIIANAFGVPSVGFAYDGKVRSHYALMDQPESLCELDAPSEAIERALELAWSQRDRIGAAVMARCQELAVPSARNFDVLSEIVATAASKPTPARLYEKRASAEMGRLLECERQLAEERTRREALEREVAELRESTTWKVGSALTALPRAIKDRQR